MGTPGYIRLKEENGNVRMVPLAKVRSTMERLQGQGIRVTTEAPLEELIPEQFGPMESDEGAPSLPRATPTERTIKAPEQMIKTPEGEVPARLPVVPLPRSPLKGSATPAAPVSKPMDAGVPAAAAPISPEDAAEAEERERSRKSLEDTEAPEDVPQGAQTVGPSIYSPLKTEKFGGAYSSMRGYLDQAGWGTGDEAAGLGGMADESQVRGGVPPGTAYIDSLLRNIGVDIPMRVDRMVREREGKLVKDEQGNVARDSSGNPVREPPADVLQSTMEYSPQGPNVVGTGPREDYPRVTGPGINAPEQGWQDTYKSTYGDTSRTYAEEDKAIREEDPSQYGIGSGMAGIAQSFLLRLLGGPDRVKEAAEAAKRAGPGIGKLIERTAAGAKDALTNPGNIASSVLSGIGHSEGDTLPERAETAAVGTAIEHGAGAAVAPFAEGLLKWPRSVGANTRAELTSQLHSPEMAHTLLTAENAGTGLETVSKPANIWGSPRTSEMGVRPSPALQQAEHAALNPSTREVSPVLPGDQPFWERPGTQLSLNLDAADQGVRIERPRLSAQPGEELRAQAADDLTDALERQRARTVKWIEDQKKQFFDSPEGQKEIPLSAILDRFPRAPEVRARIIDELRPDMHLPPPVDILNKPPMQAPVHGDPYRVRHHPPRVPEPTVNAKALDRVLQIADEEAKSHTGKHEIGLAGDFSRYAEHLRTEVRDQHYKGLSAIDKKGHELLSRWESNVSALGLDPRISPVKTAVELDPDVAEIDKPLRSEHALRVYERLAQFQDHPMVRAAVDALKEFGANVELIEAAQGLAAQRNLVLGQHAGTSTGRFYLGRFSTRLNPMDPGLRVAGLENLGLNAQAAVRGAMSGPVTPPANDYLYRLLGIRPGPTSEEQKP